MRFHGEHLLLLLALAWSGGCGGDTDGTSDAGEVPDAGWANQVVVLETFDVSAFNAALVDGMPTIDVAFYVTESGPISWGSLQTSIERAQRIFAVPGVQLRITSALRIAVPPDWQRLDPDESEVPTTPSYLETDLYAHIDELRTRLTQRNEAIFEAIISYYPEQANGVTAANTIHVLTVAEAPIVIYEWTGSEWTRSVRPTGGLSFPPYFYADRIPMEVRGVITMSSGLSRPMSDTKTLAHEIGHKVIDVSHEGIGVCPTSEASGGDLMLYGSGERIPSGAEGRWHVERLMRSPFLYRLEDGTARFLNVYQDGGVYDDRLYGDYVVPPPCIQG